MMTHHRDFLTFLDRFKGMLADQKSQTNLKYLLCRLDFNEYYHIKSIKQEEEKKRVELRMRGRGGDSQIYDGEFGYSNEEEEDYGDEDDEDDDDENDDDDGGDDDDEDGDYGAEDNNAQYMKQRPGYSMSSGMNGSY